jgi:hypothetical protein
MTMRKLFLAAAALAALSGTANAADTLPKEVFGKWCSVGNEYSAVFERCKGRDVTAEVKQGSVELFEEDTCKFTSITTRTSMGGGYENDGVLRWKSYKVYKAKAKCSGEGSVWGETMFFSYYPGSLTIERFTDNELPLEKDDDKVFCKDKVDGKRYWNSGECDGISLRFDRDRYTITKGGEEIGFCRLTSVKTVWDSKAVPATKSLGAPVQHITAQCANVTKTLVLFNTKGSWYLYDNGK